MEFVYNKTSGKYIAVLDGTVWNNCTVDADCPGRGLCFYNVPWSQFPKICSCMNTVGHDGFSCNDLSSVGYYYFVTHIFTCLIAGCAAFVGIADIIRMFQWKRLRMDAISTSLVFATLSLIATSIVGGFNSRYAFLPLTPIPGTNGVKDDKNPTGAYAMGFSFLFTTLAMLNVSLVWAQIADNALKLKRPGTQTHHLAGYRNFLIGYYVVFFGSILVALILGDYVIAAAVSIPGIILIIGTYIVGYWKMNQMIVTFSASYFEMNSSINGAADAVDSPAKTTLIKLRQSLQLIRKTALGANAFAILFALFIGVWAGTGGLFPAPPAATANTISLGIAWISVSSAVSVIIWYLHVTINRKSKMVAELKEQAIVAHQQEQAKTAALKSPKRDTARVTSGPEPHNNNGGVVTN